MKKLLSLLLASVLIFAMVGCDSTAPATDSVTPSAAESVSVAPTTEVSEVAVPEDTGKVYNIYCWNTEFQDRFKAYFEAAGLIPEGVTVNWVITPSDGGAYQAKLDQLGDRSAELSYNLGVALQIAKRPEDAANAYTQALQTNPNFAEANLNLGHVLKSLGKAAEARACWDKALAIKPDLIQ